MRSFLHITNGDSAAGLLKASGLEGDVMPWRDPMHHGPFPAAPDLETISQIRATYLAGPGLDENTAVAEFRSRDAQLMTAHQYEEVVLWFEHDLLDQLQILQLLDLFAGGYGEPNKVSMICIDRFDGIENFRGLGQLTPDQIPTLFPARIPLSGRQLYLGKTGWAAFCATDPSGLARFCKEDLAALPFLGAALNRHLEEFPWSTDGITRTERQLLTLVAKGITGPVEVFVANMELETALFMGDWTTFSRMDWLCSAPAPLLTCSPGGTFLYRPKADVSGSAFRDQVFSLTPAGREILAGRKNGASLLARDEWMGGVHLKPGKPGWLWDPAAQRLMVQEV